MYLSKIILTAAFAAFMVPVLASAETTQTAQLTKTIDKFVTAHAGELADDNFTPEQFVHLKLMAYQAAVASTCESFNLSEEKFLKEFSKVAHEQEAEMSDAEKTYFERHLLVSWGILVGGALAGAAPDPAGFCSDAESTRKDAEFAQSSIWE